MLQPPADAWLTWVGLALVAAVALGVALGLPTAPPPDADGVAAAVDAVAGAPHEATATHSLDARAVKLSPHAVALRGPGGVVRSRFAFGPVTPVGNASTLERVLAGLSPRRLYADPGAFAAAARRARARTASWQPADQLRVRSIHWGEVHVTLAGV